MLEQLCREGDSPTLLLGIAWRSLKELNKQVPCCCSVAQRPARCHPMDRTPRLCWSSPSPRVCTNSCALSWWFCPTISSSVIPFSSCLQSIIRVFSNESVLHIRWPKYWSFSFNISPSDEYSGLISFRIDWFDLLAVQGTLKILPQHHSPQAQEPWNPAISCLGVDLKNTKILKDTCIPTITATLDTIAKTRKQPKCRRTDEWIKNMGYISTVKHYSAIRKDVRMPLDDHAKWRRKTRKDWYHMISLLERIWKWIQTNFFSNEKQPHRFRKKLTVTVTVTKKRSWGAGRN